MRDAQMTPDLEDHLARVAFYNATLPVLDDVLLIGAMFTSAVSRDKKGAYAVMLQDRGYLMQAADLLPKHGYRLAAKPNIRVGNLMYGDDHDVLKHRPKAQVVVCCFVYFNAESNMQRGAQMGGMEVPMEMAAFLQSPLAHQNNEWHDMLVDSGALVAVNVRQPIENGIGVELPTQLLARAPYDLVHSQTHETGDTVRKMRRHYDVLMLRQNAARVAA